MPLSTVEVPRDDHRGRRLATALAALPLCLVVPACEGPPYTLNLAEVNEWSFGAARDQAAAIEISVPQIYSREALINDRRDEDEYLRKLLEESKIKSFTPQIKRELLSLTSISAALNASVDPAAGAAFKREERLADAQLATEREKLLTERDRQALERERARLEFDTEQDRQALERERIAIDREKARQELKKIEKEEAPASTASAVTSSPPPPPPAAGTTPASDPAAPATSTAPATGPAVGRSPAAMSAPDAGVATELNKNLEGLAKLLVAKDIDLPRGANVEPDPREEFRDRQAYRSDLRSALAEANLDDGHDDAGQALLRLQFRATVLPGQIKDKWGLARLTVERPTMTLEEMTKLYYTWLGHLTYRLNVAETSSNEPGRTNVHVRDIEGLAAASGLFDVARVYLSPDLDSRESIARDDCQSFTLIYEANAAKCDSLVLAVPRGGATSFQPILPRLEWVLLPALAEKIDQLDAIPFLRSNQCTPGDPNLAPRSLDRLVRDLGEAIFEPLTPGSWEQAATEFLATLRNDKKEAVPYWGKLPLAISQSPGNKRLSSVPPSDVPLSKGIESRSKKLFPALDTSTAQDNSTQRSKTDKSTTMEKPGKVPSEAQTILDLRLLLARARFDQVMNVVHPDRSRQVGELLHHALSILRLAPAVQAAIGGVTGRRDLGPVMAKKATLAAASYEATVQAARKLIEEFEANSGCNGRLRTLAEPALVKAPRRFCEVLAENGNSKNCQGLDDVLSSYSPTRLNGPDVEALQGALGTLKSTSVTLQGAPWVYSSQPLELAQRVSTVASAAEAVQLALSLKGTAPASGIGAAAGAQYAHAAAGKVAALERAPLVVGFTETPGRVGSNVERAEAPRFGWVFGPRAQIDAERQQLVLRQALTNYSVSADLSVPGWWPYVDLAVETAWIGNWHDARVLDLGNKKSREERRLRRTLPLNRADLDGLTQVLAQPFIGKDVQLTRIERVIPEKPSLCGDDVELLVYGANIWRSTEVFLGGVGASPNSVRVLPDMEGIRAKFPAKALNAGTLGNKLKLTVWTRKGFDEREVALAGRQSDGKCQPTLGGPDPTAPTLEVWPPSISACDEEVTFLLVAENVGDVREALLGGKSVSTSLAKEGKPFTVGVKGVQKIAPGLETLQLVVVGDKRTVAAPIKRIAVQGNCTAPTVGAAPISISTVQSTDGESRHDVCQPAATYVVRGTGLDRVARVELLERPGVPIAPASAEQAVFGFGGLPVQDTSPPAGETVTMRLIDVAGREVARQKLLAVCSAAAG